MTTGPPELSSSDAVSHTDEPIINTPKACSQSSGASKSSETSSGVATPMESMAEKNTFDARIKISSLLKDKEREWNAIAEKEGPLQLLDLPLDVLKEIVKEITHTNDLTALALTHSALHNLAIPHIYSRFDIVWPDAHATTDPRTGVDALTYGLATLCMGSVFTPNVENQFTCQNCGSLNTVECKHGMALGPQNEERRLGNSYPQYTRKFSLGNGPTDWVQEYLITKESGKMLGTLVALAVAKMTNLETFVWDMPTGILRDVWMALSSLQTRNPTRECRLERVWVRWHDNSENVHSPSGPSSGAPTHTSTTGGIWTAVGWNVPSGAGHGSSQPIPYGQARVEYPTFSVLPPLKSLSVLDIDEVDYLDEMSVVIAKSKDRLRELRVGISETAIHRDFANSWDGPDLHQVDHDASWPGESTIGERRLGGVLGVLLGRVFDIRRNKKAKSDKKDLVLPASNLNSPASQPLESHITDPMDIHNGNAPQEHVSGNGVTSDGAEKLELDLNGGNILHPGVTLDVDGKPLTNSPTMFDLNSQLDIPVAESNQSDIDSLTALMSAHGSINESNIDSLTALIPPHGNGVDASGDSQNVIPLTRRSQPEHPKGSKRSDVRPLIRARLEGKLRLHTLELERVPLSVAVLQKAFDWSVLTNLTILNCPHHEKMWTMLRKHFQPTPLGVSNHGSKHSSSSNFVFYLSLKKLHTDAASGALISFLKETLAPNTLETLFLQDRKRSTSAPPVTIDAILRGPLRRHRTSIKKLMLDSSIGLPRSPSSSTENVRWKSWMPNRDVLNFITSGRMSSLRELSIAIDYKDWHHFLQRLPQIQHLRSLNIPFVADHVTPAFDPRELALQVVDVIVLRPEVELCYMGVSHKCFEILESRAHDESRGSGDGHLGMGHGGHDGNSDDEDGGSDQGSDVNDGDEEEEDDNGTATAGQIDPDETESEESDADDSDSDDVISDDGRSKVRLRLREILFYDDKVAIFKARHGKL